MGDRGRQSTAGATSSSEKGVIRKAVDWALETLRGGFGEGGVRYREFGDPKDWADPNAPLGTWENPIQLPPGGDVMPPAAPPGWNMGALPKSLWNLGKSTYTYAKSSPAIQGALKGGAAGFLTGMGAEYLMQGQGPTLEQLGANPMLPAVQGTNLPALGSTGRVRGVKIPGQKRLVYPYYDAFGNLYWRTKARHMNPLNFYALKRAQKRIGMFEDIVMRNFRIVKHSKVKRKRRRRR